MTTFVIAFILLAVWFYSTRTPAADYVPLILVFLSAVAAIRGKSWDATRQGISRLTATGVLLFALALLGLVAGVRNTQINHSKLADVATIQNIAYRQLMTGISMVLFPVTSSWREDPTGDMAILDLARSKATIGTLANTRLVPHPDRAKDTMAMIEDTRFFLITPHGTRVTTRCGAPHQGFRALYELFDFCVATGEAKISEARDTYIATLDAKTIQLLQEVLDDDFFRNEYRSLAQHEAHYLLGLQEEVGADLAAADQTWLALLQVARTLAPNPSRDRASPKINGQSPWLLLGTYYFGSEADQEPYLAFIEKVRAFVTHVNTVMHRQDLIDTFS